MKRIVGVGLGLLASFGIGWAWGASGRTVISRALEVAELREDLLECHTAVLAARLDIYSVNFGEASRHFEAARSALKNADARLGGLGQRDVAKQLQGALTRIDEAQRMAGQINQDANARAADAAKVIDDVLAGIGRS